MNWAPTSDKSCDVVFEVLEATGAALFWPLVVAFPLRTSLAPRADIDTYRVYYKTYFEPLEELVFSAMVSKFLLTKV